MNLRTTFCCLLATAALLAQEPAKPDAKPAVPPLEGEALRALLQQLRGLDGKAWDARLAELDTQAKACDAAAEAKKKEAEAKVAEAAAESARATALRAEHEKLVALRALLASLPKDAVGVVEAAGKPAEAKPLEAKPPETKAPEAKPAETKAPDARAPDAKMPEAKSPEAKAPEAKTPDAKPAAALSNEPPPSPLAEMGKAAAADADAKTFVVWADVEPLFSEHCVSCHDPDSNKGGLDLSSYAAAMQGGGSGKSIVPGEPDQSRLYRMVAMQERPFMPKDADALPAKAVQSIRSWLEHGASEDRTRAAAFVKEREQKAKALAAAAEAASSGPAPMPVGWAPVAMRTSTRAVPMAAMARSPRAALLAVAGLGQVLLLDGNGALVAAKDVDLARIGSVGFSPDGKLLAIAGGDAGRSGRAVVLDVVTGEAVGTFGKERDVPLAVAVHHGARLVAVAGSSKRVRLYSLDRADAPTEVVWEGKHDDFVLSLAFSPDGALLAAADRSGACVLWEVDGGEVATTLRVPQGGVNAVAFHRTGALVAVACADGTARVFDCKDGKERWQKKAHAQEALAVAFGPKDAIATGGADGKMALFASDGKALGTSAAVGDFVLGVGFGETDAVVFGADAKGCLSRWEGKKVEVVTGLRGVGQ